MSSLVTLRGTWKWAKFGGRSGVRSIAMVNLGLVNSVVSGVVLWWGSQLRLVKGVFTGRFYAFRNAS